MLEKKELLTAHVTHTFPSTFQVLLPERNLPVSAADSEYVPSETPRDAPYDIRKLAWRSTGPWSRTHGRVECRLDPRRRWGVFCPH